MTVNNDIAAKLWNLCNVLRDDGITYHQYVSELTYLLFLKMAEETDTEESALGVAIPKGNRWSDLRTQNSTQVLEFYKHLLVSLGSNSSSRIRSIYGKAQTTLTSSSNLKKLIESMDKIAWFEAKQEGFGDIYEGILEKNAGEKKSGAGQYFTPRALIDSIICLVKPKPGEIIQDPAAGTAGFIVSAHRYIHENVCGKVISATNQKVFRKNQNAYIGMELVDDTHRLAMMNLFLHGIEADLIQGDALSDAGKLLAKSDVIVTNPPFGVKKGGTRAGRNDLSFPTSNKQFAFLQHVYHDLKPHGRAAVIVPDNVLFEDGVGREIRRDLMEKCNLHTILRLPSGIFYAQGVKTSVLFFSRQTQDQQGTEEIWVYDMRTNMPAIGKRRPLQRHDFAAFEEAFGADPYGRAPRRVDPENGGFRCFSRAQIADNNDKLDIGLEAGNSAEESNLDPEEVTATMIAHLRTMLDDFEELSEILNNGDVDSSEELDNLGYKE